jgi:hypothetical protein
MRSLTRTTCSYTAAILDCMPAYLDMMQLHCAAAHITTCSRTARYIAHMGPLCLLTGYMPQPARISRVASFSTVKV